MEGATRLDRVGARTVRTTWLGFSPLLLVAISLGVWLPSSSADNGNIAEQARDILAARCYRCHGENGAAARGIDVLDRERLVLRGVVVPGDVTSPLVRAVLSDAMPFGGPPLSPEEKRILHDWVIAGAPATIVAEAQPSRRFLGELDLQAEILRDLAGLPARERRFVRYFSLVHLSNAGVDAKALELYKAGLSKLLNGLSWNREIHVPYAVGESGAILRIDLRDYAWTEATWRLVEANYPYGYASGSSRAITDLTGSTVPYIRADWFADRASIAPLYYELLDLPATVGELERVLGVDTSKNLNQEYGVLRAGVRSSGVSRSNRVVERHVTAFGAYWKSYDFRSSLGVRNIFDDPIHLTSSDGGEMIFNLPNGHQAYFLADAGGRRIDAGPIEIVSDRTNPSDPVVRTAISCIACHAGGMKSVVDDVRPLFQGGSRPGVNQERVLALYVSQSELNRALDEDRERFREAVQRAGSVATESATDEPVLALVTRYRAAVGVDDVAAELGIVEDDLRSRLGFLRNDFGIGQVLAPGGAMAREVWEGSFLDAIEHLQPGAVRLAVRPAGRDWRSPGFREDRPAAPASQGRNRIAGPGDALRFARRFLVRTKTKFFTPSTLEVELGKLPEFRRAGFQFVRDPSLADVEILIDRPLFTYTYTFSLIDVQSATVVASGKLTAFDGTRAAPKLASEILNRLVRARNGQGR